VWAKTLLLNKIKINIDILLIIDFINYFFLSVLN